MMVLTAGCFGPDAPLVGLGFVVGRSDAIPQDVITRQIEAHVAVGRPISATDLQANVFEGEARASFAVGDLGVSMEDRGEGVFRFRGDGDGLRYEPGERLWIQVETEDQFLSVQMDAPPAPVLSLPETVQVGQDVLVDLSGQGFDHAEAVVFDEDGNTIWSDRPERNSEAIERLTEANGVDALLIPGEAFAPVGAAIGIGVVGFVRAEREDFDGFNLTFSDFGAGQFSAATVVVVE